MVSELPILRTLSVDTYSRQRCKNGPMAVESRAVLPGAAEGSGILN